VFFRRIRPAYVIAAWCFHMGTVLLLGLDYTMWPATVTILLIDWPAVVDRVQAWQRRDASQDRVIDDVGRTSGLGAT